MANERAIVIEAGGKSYVACLTYGWRWEHAHVNGRKDWPKAKGDERFVVVDEAVSTIDLVFPPLKVVAKYELRADLRGSSKPAWQTPSEYSNLSEGDQALYTAVYENRDQPSKSIEFDRIDGAGPPRKLPQGVSVKAPSNIDVYQWFWWTLPCTASAQYVFERLAERVSALSPEEFAVTVYHNIKHLRVEAHAITMGGVQYRPSGNLLYIDSDGRAGKHVQSVAGDNLDDCLSKVEAYCDEQMAPIKAALTVKDCPCCGKPLKGKKAAVVSRDPTKVRRGQRHDISR